MTSSIVARMSKNRRMPDGGTARTRWDSARSASGARAVSRSVIVGRGYAIRAATPTTRSVGGADRDAGTLGGRRDGRVVEEGEVPRLDRAPAGVGGDAL